MSAAKRTPGPWAWNDNGQMVAVNVLDDSMGDEFAHPVVIIETDSGFYPPRGADRDLLAAAPDLLAALQMCYAMICEECADGKYTETAERAQAAINKATGNAK